MALEDGQGELDTVIMRLPNTGTEIRNWSHYRLTSRFLTPCDQFDFEIAEQDLPVAIELLAPGTPVHISLNDRPVMTGLIDKRTVSSSRRGGTTIAVSGRDILGAVVSSSIDPKIMFSDALTVLDVATAVLAPFGITTIYNDGDLNISAMTGKSKKSKPASETSSVQLPRLTLAEDGTVSTTFTTVSVKQVIGAKKSLKDQKLQQLKPHIGEGAYEYLARVSKRFGYHIWAAADGTGAIIATPDFSSAPLNTIRHTRSSEESNIIEGRVELDLDSQPSCIVAMSGATSPGATEPKGSSVVVMVNEICGTDEQGRPLPEVQNIIARYKGAKVLAIRDQLVTKRKQLNDALIVRPMFAKDDECRTQAQLEAFCRRRMAELQHRGLVANYTVEGHTQNGIPWAVNTMAKVVDEVAGLIETLWLMERTYEKSKSSGTTTHLTFVRPHTIALD